MVMPRKGSVVPKELRPKALEGSLLFRTFVKRYGSGKQGIFAVSRVEEARNSRRKGMGRASHAVDAGQPHA
jgi:hypothetical protein